MSAIRGMLFALCVALVIPSHASAQNGAFCPRPAAGSVVTPPPDLFSQNGVLSVEFGYFTGFDEEGRTLFCFVTPGGMESPTLHVNPGDEIRVKLTNKILAPGIPSEMVSSSKNICGSATMNAASVNMHFHGTNTAPTCHSDEVIHTLVNSRDTFQYVLKIPKDEPPGLYWYHPHVHGIAAPAVLGGASGAIEVEGIANIQPAVAGLPERFLVVRDQKVGDPKQVGKKVPPFWDISLNYVPVSYPRYQPAIIKMNPSVQEFWRVTNASADTIVDLKLTYDGEKQPLQIVALDGVPTGSQDGRRHGTIVTQTDIFIPTAGRAEFIVTGPSATVKRALLETEKIDTGPLGDSDPRRPLAQIVTTAGPTGLPRTEERNGPPTVQRFEGLADANVTARRSLYFSETRFDAANSPPPWGGNFRFYITVKGQQQQLFDPDNPPAITTRQGAVEDWTIENQAAEVHEFHMHQIHFLVLAVNGVPIPKKKQQFYDTFQVPYWKGHGRFPSITVRMDFRGAVVGDFVYHCHILDHEDGGMMAIIRVLPKA